MGIELFQPKAVCIADAKQESARGCGGSAIEKGTYSLPFLCREIFGSESTVGHQYCPDSGKPLYSAKKSAARTWIQDKMKGLFGSGFTCKVYACGVIRQ